MGRITHPTAYCCSMIGGGHVSDWSQQVKDGAASRADKLTDTITGFHFDLLFVFLFLQ